MFSHLEMTVQAAESSNSTEMTTTTPSNSTVLDKLKDMKKNIHNKSDQDIGNLINLDLGDVGSVSAGTSDDVHINLNDVPVNINININFGNITIGGNRN